MGALSPPAPGSKAARKAELLRQLAEAQKKIEEVHVQVQAPTSAPVSVADRKRAAAERLRERLDDSNVGVVSIGDLRSPAIRRKHVLAAQLRAQQAAREAEYARVAAEHDAALRELIESEATEHSLRKLDDELLANAAIPRAERKRRLVRELMRTCNDGVTVGGELSAEPAAKVARRKALADRFAAQQRAYDIHMAEQLRLRAAQEDLLIDAVEQAIADAEAAALTSPPRAAASPRRGSPHAAGAADDAGAPSAKELKSIAARKRRVAAQLRAALNTEYITVTDVGSLADPSDASAQRAARKAAVRARAADALAKAEADAADAAAAYDAVQADELRAVDKAAAAAADALQLDAGIPRHVRKRKVAELLSRDLATTGAGAVVGGGSSGKAMRKARLAARLRAEAEKEEARWRADARAARQAERAAVAGVHREMERLAEAAAMAADPADRQRLLRDGYAALLNSAALNDDDHASPQRTASGSPAAARGAAAGAPADSAAPAAKGARKAALRAALEAQVAAADAALQRRTAPTAPDTAGRPRVQRESGAEGDDDVSGEVTAAMASYLTQHAATERRLRQRRARRARQQAARGAAGGPGKEDDGGDSDGEVAVSPRELELRGWRGWLDEFGLKAAAEDDAEFGMAAYRRWVDTEETRYRALQAELDAWSATVAALEAELAVMTDDDDDDEDEDGARRRGRGADTDDDLGSDDDAVERVERAMLAAAGYAVKGGGTDGGAQRRGQRAPTGPRSPHGQGFDLAAQALATADAAAERRQRGISPRLFGEVDSSPVPLETGRAVLGMSTAAVSAGGGGGFLPSIAPGRSTIGAATKLEVRIASVKRFVGAS